MGQEEQLSLLMFEHDGNLASHCSFFTAFCKPWMPSKRTGWLDFGSDPVAHFLHTSATTMWQSFVYTNKLLSNSLVKLAIEQNLQEMRLFYKLSSLS